MNWGIKSQVAGQTKTLAQQIAKQVAQEPLEVIKTGAAQVAGMEKPSLQPPPRQFSQSQPAPTQADIEVLRQQDQSRSKQLHENLEREIKEIREKKNQERILQAQAQAVPVEQNIQPLQSVASRPSRKLFSFGAKADAQRKKTRIERPLPPTG